MTAKSIALDFAISRRLKPLLNGDRTRGWSSVEGQVGGLLQQMIQEYWLGWSSSPNPDHIPSLHANRHSSPSNGKVTSQQAGQARQDFLGLLKLLAHRYPLELSQSDLPDIRRSDIQLFLWWRDIASIIVLEGWYALVDLLHRNPTLQWQTAQVMIYVRAATPQELQRTARHRQQTRAVHRGSHAA